MPLDLTSLREALEASWDEKTSYMGVSELDNPALGQCYPTSRVIQFYFPETEIVEGEVWNGKSVEKHFWNMIKVKDSDYHIDLTWSQFPIGSKVKKWKIRNRKTLGDSKATLKRVDILYKSVEKYLKTNNLSPPH